MKNLAINTLLAGGVIFLASHLDVSAQLITPDNPAAPVVTDSISTAGYYLINTYPDVTNPPSSADINALPAYAGLTQEEAQSVGPEGFSPDLTINGTTYKGDGVLYAIAGAPSTVPMTSLVIPGTGTPVQFATFALGAGTPTAFTVGLLSNYPDTTYYTLSLYGSDPNVANPPTAIVTSLVLDPAQTSNPKKNEFYYADVTGAAQGDYLVVDGYSSVNHSSQVTFGGVTFDPLLTTPEPSTYALMLGGLVVLALVTRLRRNA